MLHSVRQDSLERVGKSVYLFKMVAYRMLMILHLCLIVNYDHILCGSEFIYLNFLSPCLCAGSREVCLFIKYGCLKNFMILHMCLIWIYDLTLYGNRFIHKLAFRVVLGSQEV